MKAAKFNFKRLLVTAFVLYAGITLINQQVAIGKLTQIKAEKVNKVESIKLENEKLSKMIQDAASDAYIEKMAREQLGLVKQGEVIYINQSESKEDLPVVDN